MEPIQGRPQLAQVFRPQRQAIGEENEYLLNVGLLVLIRGFPTPDLPQLVTEKLMEVHGGSPADYNVTQATVTPFIITCPNIRVRDTIVRGGIYSIPHTGIQFKIHEWRPRFGMGYDPPTHQAWIKLVGLPLQAWNRQEVVAIIQQFGYPLQIPPFGHEAGHHRDISALIATTHPSHIPLAGRYREGDYSTQFDVIVLSWRLWDDDHFPPPDHPIPHEDPHYQPNQQNNQALAANHSSSSSSSNAPSEPTIDLSAWSPRSYKMELIAAKKWVPVTKNAQQSNIEHGQATAATHLSEQPHPPPAPISNDLVLSLANRTTQNPFASRNSTVLATKDLGPLHEPQWNPRPKKSLSLSIPLTIHITIPLFSLLMDHLHYRTLGVAQNATAASRDTSHPCAPSPMPLSLSNAYKPPALMILQVLLQEYNKRETSPLRPFKPSPTPRLLTPLPGPIDSLLRPTRTSDRNQTTSITLTIPLNMFPGEGSPQTNPSEVSNGSMQTPLYEEHFPLGPPGFEVAISDLNPQQKNPKPNQISQITLSPHEFSTHTPLSTKNNCDMEPTRATKGTHQKTKKKTVATRRSPRIQARQLTNGFIPSPPTKPKGKISKLPFDQSSTEPPLDVKATLAILQASGLHINKEIEDMITEAVRKDNSNTNDTLQDPRPPTPLHDLTPPRLMPGSDIVL